jgi:hypothetical protein
MAKYSIEWDVWGGANAQFAVFLFGTSVVILLVLI